MSRPRVKAPSRTGSLSSSPSRDPRLVAWVEALVSTPGLTAIADFEEGWREHVDRSLAAVDAIGRFDGPIVDVGSGGGSPGIPLATVFPEPTSTIEPPKPRTTSTPRSASSKSIALASARSEIAVIPGVASTRSNQRSSRGSVKRTA